MSNIMRPASRKQPPPPRWIETGQKTQWSQELQKSLARYIVRRINLVKWVNSFSTPFDPKTVVDPNTGKVKHMRQSNTACAQRRQELEQFVIESGVPGVDKVESKCRTMRIEYDRIIATHTDWARSISTKSWHQSEPDQVLLQELERKGCTWFRLWHDGIALYSRYAPNGQAPPPRTPTEPQGAWSAAGSSYGGGAAGPPARNASISGGGVARAASPADSLFDAGSEAGEDAAADETNSNSAYVQRSGGAKRQRTNNALVIDTRAAPASTDAASDSEDEPIVKSINQVNNRMSKGSARSHASSTTGPTPTSATAPRSASSSKPNPLGLLLAASKFAPSVEPKRHNKRTIKPPPLAERAPTGPPTTVVALGSHQPATPLSGRRESNFSVPGSVARTASGSTAHHQHDAGSSSGSANSIGKETNPTTAGSPSLPDLDDVDHHHHHAEPLTMGAALDMASVERKLDSFGRTLTAMQALIARQDEEAQRRDEQHAREREEDQRARAEEKEKWEEMQRTNAALLHELSEMRRERQGEAEVIRRVETKQDLLRDEVEQLHQHLIEHL